MLRNLYMNCTRPSGSCSSEDFKEHQVPLCSHFYTTPAEVTFAPMPSPLVLMTLYRGTIESVLSCITISHRNCQDSDRRAFQSTDSVANHRYFMSLSAPAGASTRPQALSHPYQGLFSSFQQWKRFSSSDLEHHVSSIHLSSLQQSP